MQSEMLRGGSLSDEKTSKMSGTPPSRQGRGAAEKVHALADVNAKANAKALEDAKKDLQKLSKKVEKILETTKKPSG